MYHILVVGIIILLLMLAFYMPQTPMGYEGFAVAAVDELLVPACVARSAPAQQLLAKIADYPREGPSKMDAAAAELRLLVSKLCCIEADIATPAAGIYRTRDLQFRTSEDLEPAMTFVGRCQRGAVSQRDIDLAIDKFSARGKELIRTLGCGSQEFEQVVAQTRLSMMQFCKPTAGSVQNAGDWEPQNVSALSQYMGFSASK